MSLVIPEVLNHYNVYNDRAKKLIGISGEIELPELEALTDTIEGAGVLGEIDPRQHRGFARPVQRLEHGGAVIPLAAPGV